MKGTWKSAVFYLALFGFCFLGGRITAQRQAVTAGASPPQGRLAIVIDDFGYNGEGTKAMLALPIPFTAAVMPFSDCSAEDGQAAVAAGKEVFIHMPMESLTGKREWVGESGVFRSMDEGGIKKSVEAAFAILPYAKGLNNHMGSAIMEDGRCLGAVMEVLKEKNAIFLDSVTTANSKGRALAEEKGIPFLARRVFLDSTDDIEVVKKNLRKAAQIALQDGSAVAIGHVGPEGGEITAKAIASLIEELEDAGVVFVTAGELAQ